MQPVPFVVASAASSATGAGQVTAWGYNSTGQLGDGTTTSSSKPVSVIFPPGVTVSAIEAGEFDSLAITSDGLYTWPVVPGSTATLSTTPVRVTFPPAVTAILAIAAGEGHNLVLTNDGLYSWGDNSHGQLGDGTTVARWTPAKVAFSPPVTNVTMIAAGYLHSLAVTNDGVYAWGHNTGGDLGDGTLINRSLPVKVGLPPAVTAVSELAAGFMDSFAITNDGLYGWGYNFFGELGDGTTQNFRTTPVKITTFGRRVTEVTRIAAGEYHTLAVTNDGLYAWGYNGGGLGDGRTISSATPVKVKFPKQVTGVSAIAAGLWHSLAITNDGLYSWGYNPQGQLGIGSTQSKTTPTKVPGENTAIDVSAGMYFSLALH